MKVWRDRRAVGPPTAFGRLGKDETGAHMTTR
jgi:hypothetical protein